MSHLRLFLPFLPFVSLTLLTQLVMESLELYDVSLPVEDITACKDIARILSCTIRPDWSVDMLETEVGASPLLSRE